MDSNNPFRVSPDQALHQRLMRSILEVLQDTPYVLKGGAALIFTRNLDRHSSDLDFDSSRRIRLEGRLHTGVKSAGVELLSLKVVKDTDTVQRYKLHYRAPASDQDTLLKVETSFRQPPATQDVEVVNGIRTYTIGVLFDSKMAAAENRTEARDLYDLAHLVSNYGDRLSPEQLSRVEVFSGDVDELAARYASSFAVDDVLRQRATVDDTVIALRVAAESYLERQNGQEVSAEKRIAFIRAVLPEAIALENAARTTNDPSVRGPFEVSVAEDNPQGPLYELSESGRLLFAVAIRDREVMEVQIFNLSLEEMDRIRFDISALQELRAEPTTEMGRDPEDQLEP